MKSTHYFYGLLCITTTLLAGCGGDDGGGTPSPGTGSPGSSYLFYQDNTNAVTAVDPANPTSPITVEPGSEILHVSQHMLSHGDFNATTKTITNNLPYAMMYAKTDGRFYRVSALKSGSLTPTQVSNESNANQICWGSSESDYSNPDNAQYVYALPGPDGNCATNNDNIWKMIRLGMTVNEAPVPAQSPINSIINNTTGAISGWLVVNNAGNFEQCDQNFSSCVAPTITGNIPLPPSSINTAWVPAYFDFIKNRFLLNINENIFATYDGNTRTLTTLLGTTSSFTSTPVTDEGNVYFTHNGGLFRATSDGSIIGYLLPENTTNFINQLELTAKKVIYQTPLGISTISKAGGTSLQIAAIPSMSSSFYIAVESHIYYSTYNPTTLTYTASFVDEDANNHTTFSNAFWNGFIFPTTYDLTKAPNLLLDPDTIMLAEGIFNGSFASADLTLFDPATNTARRKLGTLPNIDNLTGMFCGGQTGNVLCDGFLSDPAQSDIFFVNTETENSLLRITSTPGKFEFTL